MAISPQRLRSDDGLLATTFFRHTVKRTHAFAAVPQLPSKHPPQLLIHQPQLLIHQPQLYICQPRLCLVGAGGRRLVPQSSGAPVRLKVDIEDTAA